jgi:hypothetical protein
MQEKAARPDPRPGEWWCNFCDFRSDDEDLYLKHSCAEELKKRGTDPAGKKGQTHCS